MPPLLPDVGKWSWASWKLWTARPICLRLLAHCSRAAASLTFWTAGSNRPMRAAMMAITTSSSIKVKAERREREWRSTAGSSWGSRKDDGGRHQARPRLGPGRRQLPEAGLTDVLHLGVGVDDEALAVLAGLLVGDERRRGAADLGDRHPVQDDERLLVALGDEAGVDALGVDAVHLQDEAGLV